MSRQAKLPQFNHSNCKIKLGNYIPHLLHFKDLCEFFLTVFVGATKEDHGRLTSVPQSCPQFANTRISQLRASRKTFWITGYRPNQYQAGDGRWLPPVSALRGKKRGNVPIKGF